MATAAAAWLRGMGLALGDLAETVRTGYRHPSGVPLATVLERPTRMAEQARALVEESALWVAPSIVGACDWAAVTFFTAEGNGADAATNALFKAYSPLGAEGGQGAGPRPGGPAAARPRPGFEPAPARRNDLLLLANPFTWLPDDDAVHLLRATMDLLPEPGRVLLVGQVRTQDADDLQLRCAFGSGLRTRDEIGELAARAGLGTTRVQEIGWNHHLWELRPNDQRTSSPSKRNRR